VPSIDGDVRVDEIIRWRIDRSIRRDVVFFDDR
jgi:hypothetical protein